MNRTEYKAFMRSLRSDCRAFREAHGGYPCFRRSFWHGGVEHTVTRYRDYAPTWHTYTRASVIRQRPVASLIHAELDCAAGYRRRAVNSGWTSTADKRGAALSVKIAREWRMERDSGFYAAQQAA